MADEKSRDDHGAVPGYCPRGGEALAASGREPPRAQPSAVPTAEQEYSRGMAAKNAKNWPAAVEFFQKAVSLKPAFPEAWNELGFALRNQGNYPDSLKAYDEALRLRPNFPKRSSTSARPT